PEGTFSSYTVDMNVINPFGVQLTMRVYKTWNDYINNTNVFTELQLQPGMTSVGSNNNWHIDKFQPNDSFYFDVVSDDGIYSSWGSSRLYDSLYWFYLTGQEILNTSNIFLHSMVHRTGHLRNAFFRQGAASTRWVSVDKFDHNWNSLWNTSTEEQRYREVIINRDLSYTLRTKLPGGNIREHKHRCMLIEKMTNDISPLILRAVPGQTELGDTYMYATSQKPENNITTTDTAVYYNSNDYWLMVRQQ
ncbi:MAG TPA: hypothetical protein VEB40_11200, partial [Flavipsychrobacter sp.]|nr:hypothetical protein [Flavipsychrobacter sp.]